MSHTLEKSYFIFKILSSNLSPDLCESIFGKDLKNHMWEKWLSQDTDIIKFLSCLDSFNRKRILDWAENSFNGDAKFSDRF